MLTYLPKYNLSDIISIFGFFQFRSCVVLLLNTRLSHAQNILSWFDASFHMCSCKQQQSHVSEVQFTLVKTTENSTTSPPKRWKVGVQLLVACAALIRKGSFSFC
jgi:hypothetical protein